MSLFVEKSKSFFCRKGNWLHLVKLNSSLRLLELTKRDIVLARTNKQCDKYIFRDIKNTKNGQKLRNIDKPKDILLYEVPFSSF